MLEIYPKEEVKSAFYERDYAEGRQKTIEELENFVRQGINAELCQKEIDQILKTTSPCRP